MNLFKGTKHLTVSWTQRVLAAGLMGALTLQLAMAPVAALEGDSRVHQAAEEVQGLTENRPTHRIRPRSVLPDQPRRLYRFYHEGQLIHEDYILNGGTLLEPDHPQVQDRVFLGWFPKDDPEAKEPLQFGVPIELKSDEIVDETVDYEARYAKAFPVTFLRQYGEDKASVVQELPVAENETVPESVFIELAGGKGKRFQHWSLRPEGEPFVAADHPITEPTKLYAVFGPGALISLDTQGGTPVVPVSVNLNQTFGEVKDMIRTPNRPGYDFIGWDYVDENDPEKIRQPVTDELLIKGDLQLLARWEPRTDTPFTVINWLENPNDDQFSVGPINTYYGTTDTQAFSEAVREQEGKTLSQALLDIQTLKESYQKEMRFHLHQLYDFSVEKSEQDKTIDGDGETILNFYWTRKRGTPFWERKTGGTAYQRRIDNKRVKFYQQSPNYLIREEVRKIREIRGQSIEEIYPIPYPTEEMNATRHYSLPLEPDPAVPSSYKWGQSTRPTWDYLQATYPKLTWGFPNDWGRYLTQPLTMGIFVPEAFEGQLDGEADEHGIPLLLGGRDLTYQAPGEETHDGTKIGAHYFSRRHSYPLTSTFYLEIEPEWVKRIEAGNPITATQLADYLLSSEREKWEIGAKFTQVRRTGTDKSELGKEDFSNLEGFTPIDVVKSYTGPAKKNLLQATELTPAKKGELKKLLKLDADEALNKDPLNEDLLVVTYKRNQYQVLFYPNDGGEIQKPKPGHEILESDPIYYEAPIASVEPQNYVIDKTRLKDGRVFKGWYRDQQFKTGVFSFAGEKMPAHDLILYGRWEYPDVHLRIHEFASLDSPVTEDHVYRWGSQIPEDLKEKLKSKPHEVVTPPDDFTSVEDSFYYWFTYGPNHKRRRFSLNQRLIQDVDIYPLWGSTTIEVTYLPETGDDQTLAYHRQIDRDSKHLMISYETYQDRVEALTGKRPPDPKPGQHFIGWKVTEPENFKPSPNELHPGLYWANEDSPYVHSPQTYRPVFSALEAEIPLTYHANGGQGEDIQSEHLPNNERLKALDPTGRFSREGFAFLGWNTQADAKGTWFQPGEHLILNRENEKSENHLYAIWGRIRVDKVVNAVYDKNNVKRSENTVQAIGDQIEFVLTIHNDSPIDLPAFEYTDPQIGIKDAVKVEQTLPANGSLEYVIEQKWVVAEADLKPDSQGGTDTLKNELKNTATVKAVPPVKANPPLPPLEGDGEVKIPVKVPRLSLTKQLVSVTAANGTSRTGDPVQAQQAGDRITYQFVIKNTGHVDIQHLKLKDVLISEQPITGLETVTLKPNEAWTSANLTYTVKQADVDKGLVENTGTVEGETPDKTPLDPVPSNKITVTIPRQGDYTIEKVTHKVTDQSGNQTRANHQFEAIDDQIYYTFKVKNTGNVTIKTILLKDDKLNWSETFPVDLAPGATWEKPIENHSYAVTQTDLDAGSVTNTVTVTPGYPEGTPPVPDRSTSNITPNRPIQNLAFEKALSRVTDQDGQKREDGQFKAVGDQIYYKFKITNNGNQTLDNFLIKDSKLGEQPITVTGPLAPGASKEIEAPTPYRITQKDLDAGKVLNQATVTGETPDKKRTPEKPSNESSVPGTGTRTFTAIKKVIEVLEKTDNGLKPRPQPQFEAVGDEIRYGIEITNTGTLTLQQVHLVDQALGIDEVVNKAIEPGKTLSIRLEKTHRVTQEDLENGMHVNKAQVSLTPDPNHPTLTPPPVTVEGHTPGLRKPQLALKKRVSKVTDKTGEQIRGAKELEAAGDRIYYTFVIENTGNVTVENPKISDPKLSKDPIVPPSPENAEGQTIKLKPGESIEVNPTEFYEATQADIDLGRVPNQATVTGYLPPPSGQPDRPSPPDPEKPDPGQPEKPDPENPDPEQPPVPTEGMDLPPVPSNEVITYVSREASVEVVKETLKVTDSTGEILREDQHFKAVGDKIFYRFRVTNTGNVTIKGIHFKDDLLSLDQTLQQELAPGQSHVFEDPDWYYEIKQADLDAGQVLNILTSKPELPAGLPPLPAVPTTNLTPNDPAPSLQLSKMVDRVESAEGTPREKTNDQFSYSAVGDRVYYKFVITNTGNLTLHDLEIIDSRLGQDPIKVEGSLAPQQSATVVAERPYVILQADLDAGSVINIAYVEGKTPDNNPTPSIPSNPVEIKAQKVPQFEAVKSVSKVLSASGTPREDGHFKAVGDQIFYQFAITNTGNVTLHAFEIDDPLLKLTQAIEPEPASGLLPGQSFTWEAPEPYIVTEQDLAELKVENAATVQAKIPDDPTGGPRVPVKVTTPGDPPAAGVPFKPLVPGCPCEPCDPNKPCLNDPHKPDQPNQPQAGHPALPKTGEQAPQAALGLLGMMLALAASAVLLRRRLVSKRER